MLRKNPNIKNQEKIQGTVLNFLPRKGYGFIMGDDGVKVFVHFSDIKGKEFRTLTENEPVEYYRIQGAKGEQAVEVTRLDPPEVRDLPPIISDNKTW